MTRIPLHYQILAAMVVGTVVGILANPGDVPLQDANGTIRRLEAGLELAEFDAAGQTVVRQTFADAESFRKRYPKLAHVYLADAADGELKLQVRDRRLHLAEDIDSIAINYTRQYVLDDAKSSIVTYYKAASAADLKERFAFWKDEYERYAAYGWGVPRQISIWSKFVGDLFLRLLKMITVPLIVTSLVTGVASLGNTARFGSMFGKTLLYYGVTSLLAITTGLLMVNLIRPGVGAELPGGGEAEIVGEAQSLGGVFVGLVNNMVPANPVQSLAGAEFLAIITFSILLGIFILRTGDESAETLRRFFQSAFAVMMHMTMFIISLAPLGVLAFMLFATVSQGLEIFRTLAWYMLAVFLALVVHAVVVLPLVLKFVARRSPWRYLQAMSPALMTAFSTASSNGTLPLTITCVEERAGISNKVSSFVLPLGATINMDGTALYEAVAVLFIAQATAFVNPDFTLTFGQQILVAITALLASIGAAGIPHAGLVMMAIVLQAVGLPLEAQGVIIAVDRVLDMCRTSVNVWSDSCGCAVLARLEGNAAS